MAIFVGTHENKVDRKGRVSVPAKFREAVAEARELRGLLVAEDSDIDTELIEESFSPRDVSFFDPLRGGFLLGY